MEHVIRMMQSSAFFLAVVFVFTFGVVLWLGWARFFHDSEAIGRVPRFVMALAALMFFAGGYTAVVSHGLDGVVCAAGRRSLHVVCSRHDESPVWFWVMAAMEMLFCVVFMLAALMVLMAAVAPARSRAAAGPQQSRMPAGTDTARPGAQGARKDAGWLFMVAVGVVAVPSLGWIVHTLDRAGRAQAQVAGALASVAHEKIVVEAYLQAHGALPADNESLGLPPTVAFPASHVGGMRIHEGSILLTFDEATADEHLRGHVVMWLAVRDDRRVRWHCAGMDIADKYLPRPCRIGL